MLVLEGFKVSRGKKQHNSDGRLTACKEVACPALAGLLT